MVTTLFFNSKTIQLFQQRPDWRLSFNNLCSSGSSSTVCNPIPAPIIVTPSNIKHILPIISNVAVLDGAASSRACDEVHNDPHHILEASRHPHGGIAGSPLHPPMTCSSSGDEAATGSPSVSVMRLLRGLEYVVGVAVDFVAFSGRRRPPKNREVKNCWLNVLEV